jgi:hypothetical protein
MGENKNEATNENYKNVRKHWPQELKDRVYGKILELKKDPQGRTIYVKTNDNSRCGDHEFHIGYNMDGTVATIMNAYDRADKKPVTFTNSYGSNNRTTFFQSEDGFYFAGVKRNSCKKATDNDAELQFEIDSESSGEDLAPEIRIRDAKNRVVFSQSKRGDITQYTYLRDCAEVITDVSCMDYKQVKCCGAIHIESSQYHVHYEYKANDTSIKYACVTENGVLAAEYFFDNDDVGSFIHVIDYKNQTEYWAERDRKREMPKYGSYSPTNYIKQSGLRFNREEEYEAYRKAQVTEVKVQEAAKKMAFEMMSNRQMPFMCCGPWG